MRALVALALITHSCMRAIPRDGCGDHCYYYCLGAPQGSTLPTPAPLHLPQSRLIKLCERSGWDPQFLVADHATDENLVDRCIRELVACRGAGRFELAIALADAACGAGLVHSRITTNRERAARALAAQQPAGALAVVRKGWVWPYRLPSLVGPAAAGFSRLRLHGRQPGVRLTFAEKLERLLQVC